MASAAVACKDVDDRGPLRLVSTTRSTATPWSPFGLTGPSLGISWPLADEARDRRDRRSDGSSLSMQGRSIHYW